MDIRNLFHNIPILIECFFFKDWLPYNSIDNFFTMYVISIPFVLLGVQKAAVQAVKAVKERRFSAPLMLLFWLAAQTIMGLLIDEPNVNKVNGRLLFAAVFCGVWDLACLDADTEKDGKKSIPGCGGRGLHLFFRGFRGVLFWTLYRRYLSADGVRRLL